MVMAAAPGIKFVNGLFTLLWEEILLYRGFRDTHKFAALLALAYAYLGAFGLQTLVEKVKLYATSPRWR